MPTVKFYIISCSADMENPEPLFIWGEGANDHSMPTTREETERRIATCQEKTKCLKCDAEIHHINLMRLRNSGIVYDEEYGRRGKHKKTS